MASHMNSDGKSGAKVYPPVGLMRQGFGMGGMHRAVPVDKPKNALQTIMRLWQYFGREKKWFILVFILVGISCAFTLAAPRFIAIAVDAIDLRARGRDANILMILIALSAFYMGDALLSFLQNFIMAGVGQKMILALRRSLFQKLQKLPIVFFDTTTHGDMMSRFSNDIDNISSTISQSTTQLMSSIITIAGALTMMLLLSPTLTLAAVVTVPLVFVLTGIVTKRTRKLYVMQQKFLGKLGGHIEETITGLEVVRAFCRQTENINEFEKISEEYCRIGIKSQIWAGFLMPLMNVINNLSFTLVAFTGSVFAMRGLVSVGMISGFLIYSRLFVRPLNEVANIYNSLLSALAGAERFFDIIDTPNETQDSQHAQSVVPSAMDVAFKNVSFGYSPHSPVLQNISFTVPAGSAVALVGPTGAGKTTIVNLLSRFYDVTSGEIFVGGRNIKDYARHTLRSLFGIVLQDTYLFTGTIEDNIRYGRIEATAEEVIDAAKAAGAHGFISRLPAGYHSQLTESGSNLSQGQRQLLSIARAVLADRPILILDEATSSVDTRTELHIQKAMLRLMQNRTTFIIAHRLSTIREADHIMVVSDGGIVEAGSHDELMAFRGVYSRMYQAQIEARDE